MTGLDRQSRKPRNRAAATEPKAAAVLFIHRRGVGAEVSWETWPCFIWGYCGLGVFDLEICLVGLFLYSLRDGDFLLQLLS